MVSVWIGTPNGGSLSELSKCDHAYLSKLTQQQVDVVIAFLQDGFSR